MGIRAALYCIRHYFTFYVGFCYVLRGTGLNTFTLSPSLKFVYSSRICLIFQGRLIFKQRKWSNSGPNVQHWLSEFSAIIYMTSQQRSQRHRICSSQTFSVMLCLLIDTAAVM